MPKLVSRPLTEKQRHSNRRGVVHGSSLKPRQLASKIDWMNIDRTVSAETFDGLLSEAKAHPRYAGLWEEDIRYRLDAELAYALRDFPWWYGHLDDTKHRQAQERYHRDRLAADQRDILAKEKGRLYEIGYQDRKAKRDRRAVLDTLATEGLGSL